MNTITLTDKELELVRTALFSYADSVRHALTFSYPHMTSAAVRKMDDEGIAARMLPGKIYTQLKKPK